MNQSVMSVLVYLLAASTIAVLLERIPGWQDRVPAKYKVLIVTLMNIVAPFALTLLRVFLPPEVQNESVSQLLIGAAMAAASFIAHQIDDWLKKLQNSPPAGSLIVAPAVPPAGAVISVPPTVQAPH